MIKLNCCGTHEEVMTEINNAPISDGFKEYIRTEHNKHCEKLNIEMEFMFSNDLDAESERNSIPIHGLVPKGMSIKEYFGKEQRLLRGESISYINFD